MDSFLLVKNGKLEVFEGDLDDYEQSLLGQDKKDAAKSAPPASADTTKQAPSAGLNKAPAGLNKKEQRQQSAERRKELQPLRDRLKRVEREIEKCQQARMEIEVKLSDATIYDENFKDELNIVLFDQARLSSRLQSLEEEWLVLSESLEGA